MVHRPLRGIALSLSAFAALALAVYACAVNPVTGKSELALVSFTQEEEVSLGAKAYGPAVQQQGGFYRDGALEAYVQGVGVRLARVSHRPDLSYRYRVLNSSVPNAFALPGGFIVINRGLLVGLKSEAEMAAVLGHETGHVTAKHSLAGYQRAIAANVLLAGISIAAGDRAGIMQISGITASLINNGFSRDQEREADWLGIDYMVKAGYNPEGAVRLQEYFYSELEGGRNPLFVEGLFRTHPFSAERLANARAYIAQRYPNTVRNPNYTFNETTFLRNTARLKEVQKAYDLADEGDKLRKEKRHGEALAKYEAAAAREPDQSPFFSSIGHVHLIRKNYASAETALRRAIRLDDEFFEPHLLLGALHHQKNEHRAAIPELSRSMDLLPTKEAASLLSKSYEAIGDRENARKYAEMAK
ncbi:MAG TPA: M48 family metalloprotease [Candidatus Deferrimicrobiaceae bacterium]|nr:M48 family metalloprotease [Candidatus Deferrimicrobiaceae bacterium]